MAVQIEKWMRKPLYVNCVRVDQNNMAEAAEWCQGTIEQDEQSGNPYIKVRVHNAKNLRQTKAFIGDWILYGELGYKCYTNKAFKQAFDKAREATEAELKAAFDKNVTNEREKASRKGTSHNQKAKERLGNLLDGRADTPSTRVETPTETAKRQIAEGAELEAKKAEAESQSTWTSEDAAKAWDEAATTPQGEPITLEPATPEAIMQAAQENDAARAQRMSPEEVAAAEARQEAMHGSFPQVSQEEYDQRVLEEKRRAALRAAPQPAPGQDSSFSGKPTNFYDGEGNLRPTSEVVAELGRELTPNELEEKARMDREIEKLKGKTPQQAEYVEEVAVKTDNARSHVGTGDTAPPPQPVGTTKIAEVPVTPERAEAVAQASPEARKHAPRVLSIDEQASMSREEVAELLKSGDAILQQDIPQQ